MFGVGRKGPLTQLIFTGQAIDVLVLPGDTGLDSDKELRFLCDRNRFANGVHICIDSAKDVDNDIARKIALFDPMRQLIKGLSPGRAVQETLDGRSIPSPIFKAWVALPGLGALA